MTGASRNGPGPGDDGPAAGVPVKLNGVEVLARPGESVLSLARRHGVAIPALCHLDGLSEVAACRLCVVEVAPTGRLLPACSLRVEAGLAVTVDSPRLRRYRRGLIELAFLERNHVCAVCVASGDCALQDLAQQLGVTHFDLPAVHPPLAVDASHAAFAIDHNRCVLCLRCVRVCAEIEAAFTWGVSGRGADTSVVTDAGTAWGTSPTCTSCGKCVQVCPTGALFEKGRPVAGARDRRPYLPFAAREPVEVGQA